MRIVAATNRDLEQAVADGQFREDLFFRLNVVCITLPPLRERREEIPALAEHFLEHYSVHYNKPSHRAGAGHAAPAHEYDWPGNVRELENLIKRAVVLGDATESLAARSGRRHCRRASRPDGPDRRRCSLATRRPTPHRSSPSRQPLRRPALTGISLKDISRIAAREAERELIFRMLQQTRWNRKETAEILGISYKALLYKIKETDSTRPRDDGGRVFRRGLRVLTPGASSSCSTTS